MFRGAQGKAVPERETAERKELSKWELSTTRYVNTSN